MIGEPVADACDLGRSPRGVVDVLGFAWLVSTRRGARTILLSSASASLHPSVRASRPFLHEAEQTLGTWLYRKEFLCEFADPAEALLHGAPGSRAGSRGELLVLDPLVAGVLVARRSAGIAFRDQRDNCPGQKGDDDRDHSHDYALA